MQNAKKQIILNEILFWKQHKLLPEQYCDFLMTLYSEGNDIKLEDQVSHKKALKAKEHRRKYLFSILAIIGALALIILLFMVKNMTELVISIVGVMAILFLISAFKLAKKNEMITPILHIVASLLILALSVKVSVTYFEGNNLVLFTLLIMNCIFWTLSGVIFKIMYFTLAGVLGLIVIVGYKFIFL